MNHSQIYEPASNASISQSHLTQRDLARRWNKSEGTLERFRSEGIGPRFLKLGGTVRYRLEDIEAYERDCLYDSSSSKADLPAAMMAAAPGARA